jgi:hypothetical protein
MPSKSSFEPRRALSAGATVERRSRGRRSGDRLIRFELPPDDGKSYTPREIRTFLEIAGFSQIADRHRGFAKQIVKDGRAVDIDAFPSVKAATFTVFYKFYADKTRKASVSDAYDIIISSAAPYVDAIITENQQAEVLDKTKRRDDFLGDLRVFTLRDFRDAPP